MSVHDSPSKASEGSIGARPVKPVADRARQRQELVRLIGELLADRWFAICRKGSPCDDDTTDQQTD